MRNIEYIKSNIFAWGLMSKVAIHVTQLTINLKLGYKEKNFGH